MLESIRNMLWLYLGFAFIIIVSLGSLFISSSESRVVEVSQYQLNDIVEDKLVQLDALQTVSENSERIFHLVHLHILTAETSRRNKIEDRTKELIINNDEMIKKMMMLGFKDTSLKRLFSEVVNSRKAMLATVDEVISRSHLNSPYDTSFKEIFSVHSKNEEKYRKSLNAMKKGLIKRTRAATLKYGGVMSDSRTVFQKLIGLVAFIMTISVLIFGLFVHRLRVDKIELEGEISRRSRAELSLNQSLEHAEALLSEVHHRVKNNLSMLSGLIQLKAINTRRPEVKLVLGEIHDRIFAIAKVHEMLYQSENFALIDLKSYILELLQGYPSITHNQTPVKIEFDCDPIYLKIQEAISVGLLVNELIANSLKHAIAEPELQIDISYKQSESKMIRMTYSDNGQGFDAALFEKNSETLGFALIRTLSKQLNAENELNTVKGTRFVFRFLNKLYDEAINTSLP